MRHIPTREHRDLSRHCEHSTAAAGGGGVLLKNLTLQQVTPVGVEFTCARRFIGYSANLDWSNKFDPTVFLRFVTAQRGEVLAMTG